MLREVGQLGRSPWQPCQPRTADLYVTWKYTVYTTVILDFLSLAAESNSNSHCETDLQMKIYNSVW